MGDVSLSLQERDGRIVLVAVTLSAGAVFLDGTVVNVATVAIQRELYATFTTIQWIVSGYLLTLGSLVLVGGALGDLLGRRAVYLVGVGGFALASVACGLAPDGTALVAARIVQGVFAAIVAPSGLAILNAMFIREQRARAIGLWTAWGSIATALGPFIGGWLVDSGPGGWRWAFLLNVPLMAVAFWGGLTAVPHETGHRDPTRPLLAQFDVVGASLVSLGLALLAFPLIEWARFSPATNLAMLLLSALVLAAFVRHEGRTASPMMPLDLWRSPDFSALGVMTFLLYGVLGGWLFLLAIVLQRALDYSALEAGLALFPITILLGLGSPWVAKAMPRVGGWTLLTAGSALCGTAQLLQLAVQPGGSYWLAVLPGVLVFALGFTLIVVPITSMTLAAAPDERGGIASGISNANARIAGLIAVASLPLLAGLSVGTFPDDEPLIDGFRIVLVIGAALCAVSAVLGAVFLTRHRAQQ
jgi:EmrB/QacA subfamily drug resistance transporter